ncbi:MAG: glycosyltransferase [Paludibacter sp.]|nr:glycosyltransferase [Paludibacter sp.]
MKISIIMPTYNDEKHIVSSLQSVIDQTYSNWELLIMDDGSKDNTKKAVAGLNDKRIHYFRQENKGQLVALNNLCQYITGDIVLMLHSDDSLYSNDCLQRNLEHFSDPEIDGIYGDFHQFFDSGKPDEVGPAPKRMDKSAVEKLITLLGSNITFDHFFVRRSAFEKNVRYNYLSYYMPYWLKFQDENVTSLNLKYTSTPWYHYRVYDQNYTNSVIGNFEVYFTRFRSIFFLSDYFTVPFPLIQKELLRRFKIKGPVLNKKASKRHIAKCYKANIRSMKQRTENAYTDYFDNLILFYEKKSERTIMLQSPIEISYRPSEARKFYHDLKNNTVSSICKELIENLPIGFKCIRIKAKAEKVQLEELLKFLCIKAEIEVLEDFS